MPPRSATGHAISFSSRPDARSTRRPGAWPSLWEGVASAVRSTGRPGGPPDSRPAIRAPFAPLIPRPAAPHLLLAALLLLGLLPAPAPAQPAQRPADLAIIQEKTTFRGPETIGVYGRLQEPGQPGRWRVKIWRELIDRLTLDTESIDCRPGHATRIGTVESRVVVQTLNPGGLITPANRLDHLIWWATCAPEQAGRDPAQLGGEARRLGFDGLQQENLTVLPGLALPHP